MKTIGLIGGTSWYATVDYYTKINQSTNRILGGLQSARMILYSVNFAEFKQNLDENKRDEIAAMFTHIAQKLEQAGVDFIAIAANTPHIVAEEIRDSVSVPLLHIAEATAEALSRQQIKKAALLGTKPTMEMPFFKDILKRYNIEAIVPDENSREFIHQSIFTELSHGISRKETKERFLEIINDLQNKGAEAVIFGCTELCFLIKENESSLPVFDTTAIHIDAIVKLSLNTI